MSDAAREALARMDAAREGIRRLWLVPMPELDPDVPEVIGTRDYEDDPDYLQWKNSSCTREK